MNGRAAVVGFAVIGGAYLLISNFSEVTLFSKDGHVTTHAARAALGAFLLVIALVFLYKNLK